ncbi:MAG: CBS domain-containing protein [Deltaproteobacteria bacterium]|nr:CBS domain-containing protein [Deltaproteobacteria bacterium]
MERIQRTIGEVLGQKSWPELPPGATVAAAQEAMARVAVDCVLVVEEGVLKGVFTSRDFMNRVAAAGRLPAEVPLGDVMTSQPETLKRHHCVTYAINRMATRNIRNLPVVDDHGRPVGLLQIWDVMTHMADIFEEISRLPPERPTDNIWQDLGGG